MRDGLLLKSVLLREAIGFAVLLCLIWLDEIFDLPHRILGQEPDRGSLLEGAIESGVVILLAAGVFIVTAKLLKKVKLLEGVLPVCSFCKKIREGKEWIPIESYIRDRSHADFTHGLCPDCVKEHYGHLQEKVKGPLKERGFCRRRQILEGSGGTP